MSAPNDLRIRDRLEFVLSGHVKPEHRYALEQYLEDEGFGCWGWEVVSSHATKQTADAALRAHEQVSA